MPIRTLPCLLDVTDRGGSGQCLFAMCVSNLSVRAGWGKAALISLLMRSSGFLSSVEVRYYYSVHAGKKPGVAVIGLIALVLFAYMYALESAGGKARVHARSFAFWVC